MKLNYYKLLLLIIENIIDYRIYLIYMNILVFIHKIILKF